METMRNDFTSFQDPMTTFTSLGNEVEGSLLPDAVSNFAFGRRTSLMSAASSGPAMSFGSSPTDAASSSVPSTPIAEGHRSGGGLTPGDMLLTPESPCPPSWRSYGRGQSMQGLHQMPFQRYSNLCQDLTRSMLNAGPSSQYHEDPHASQHYYHRQMSLPGLDPIQTQFSPVDQNMNELSGRSDHFMHCVRDDASTNSFASLATGGSDTDCSFRSWPGEGLHESLASQDRATRPHETSIAPPQKQKRSSRQNGSSKGPDRVIRGAHPCEYPGCEGKRFQRKEHLRRHQQSKHGVRKFECLQGRQLGAKFCNKLQGIKPISRSDNVNQHSCTHVINGLGKTRNSLCELNVAIACIKTGAHTPSDREKAEKQCEALKDHIQRVAEEANKKGVKSSKPKPNVHIAHEVMERLGFDCSAGCPIGEMRVFEGGDRGLGPLCMAFVGNPEPKGEQAVLDGDHTLAASGRGRKAKL